MRVLFFHLFLSRNNSNRKKLSKYSVSGQPASVDTFANSVYWLTLKLFLDLSLIHFFLFLKNEIVRVAH